MREIEAAAQLTGPEGLLSVPGPALALAMARIGSELEWASSHGITASCLEHDGEVDTCLEAASDRESVGFSDSASVLSASSASSARTSAIGTATSLEHPAWGSASSERSYSASSADSVAPSCVQVGIPVHLAAVNGAGQRTLVQRPGQWGASTRGFDADMCTSTRTSPAVEGATAHGRRQHRARSSERVPARQTPTGAAVSAGGASDEPRMGRASSRGRKTRHNSVLGQRGALPAQTTEAASSRRAERLDGGSTWQAYGLQAPDAASRPETESDFSQAPRCVGSDALPPLLPLQQV